VITVFDTAGFAFDLADPPRHLIQDDVGQGELAPRTERIDIFSNQ
jgi:hypothetical protein